MASGQGYNAVDEFVTVLNFWLAYSVLGGENVSESPVKCLPYLSFDSF